jgi:transposase
METDKERQRRGFVADHASGQWSMTELCERYGISRPTGYELLRRVEAEGSSPGEWTPNLGHNAREEVSDGPSPKNIHA